MTTPCQKARSLVSAGLDTPLNDLEQHFVTVHLGRCGACSAFQEDAKAFTTLLRDAPLEPVPSPISVSNRGQRSRVQFRTIAQIASVASVVIAAGTIALAADLPSTTSETSALGSAGSLAVDEDSIRKLRRVALVQHELPIVADPGTQPTGSESVESLLKPALPVDGG
jgi:hypothetical protein